MVVVPRPLLDEVAVGGGRDAEGAQGEVEPVGASATQNIPNTAA